MGMYTWLNEGEFDVYSKLTDKGVNEVYQEVREIFPKVYVREQIVVNKKWFGKSEETVNYTVYVRTSNNDSEVRVMNMAYSNRELLMNFLFGLLNGHHWTIEGKKKKKKKTDGQ